MSRSGHVPWKVATCAGFGDLLIFMSVSIKSGLSFFPDIFTDTLRFTASKVIMRTLALPQLPVRANISSCSPYTHRSTAIVNLIETSLNVCLFAVCDCGFNQSISQLLYLYFIHIAPSNIAPLFGFSGAMLTLSKTTLWVLQEHFCGWCSYSAGLTDFGETFKFWIAPNV